MPIKTAIVQTATGLFADFLLELKGDPFLLGPDEESRQWVEEIAARGAFDFDVARKERRGDRDVSIQLPERSLAGRDVVIVDDVVSTAKTLMGAVEQLKEQGGGRISVLVSHALFSGDAEQALRKLGVDSIVSSDSVPHATNAVRLAPIIAQAIRAL